MTYARPADGTAIVRAAVAWHAADVEYKAADEAHTQALSQWAACARDGAWGDADGIALRDTWIRCSLAQDAYNDARAALLALCATRLPCEAVA